MRNIPCVGNAADVVATLFPFQVLTGVVSSLHINQYSYKHRDTPERFYRTYAWFDHENKEVAHWIESMGTLTVNTHEHRRTWSRYSGVTAIPQFDIKPCRISILNK